MEYVKIVDNLYLGSYNDIIKEYYKNANIDVVINVAKECKNLDNTVIYHHYQYCDSESEKIFDSFDIIADLIHSYRLQNKNVFIHCYAGISRSATFVIVYLIKHMNYSLNYAYNYVYNLRWIAPNLGFIHQMMKFEAETTGTISLDYDSIAITHIYNNTGFVSKDKIKEIYYKLNKNVDLTMEEVFSDYM